MGFRLWALFSAFRRAASVGGYFVRVPVSWHLHRDVGVDLLRGCAS